MKNQIDIFFSKNALRKFCLAGSIIFFILVLYFLGVVLKPFLIALFLAYLGNPLVERLMRFKISRMLAVAIVFIIIFFGVSAIILISTPIVQTQFATLISSSPDILNTALEKLNWLFDYVGLPKTLNLAYFKNMVSDYFSTLDNVPLLVWTTTISSGKAFISFVIEIIIIPFVTFYLLRDWEKISNSLRNVNKRSLFYFDGLLNQCETAFGAYIRGQLTVVFCMSIFYMITFTISGLKVGVLIGLVMGILTILPYIGSIIGLGIACFVALAQTGEMTPLIWVLLSYAIGHLLENFYLTPKFIGNNIGLHPVAVIFVILLGGTLFGAWGVILALPVSSLLVILARYFYHFEQNKI